MKTHSLYQKIKQSGRNCGIALGLLCGSLSILHAQEIPYTYSFFENSLMPEDYYYSEASYTSPSWIKHTRNRLPVSQSEAFSPGNSLELSYISKPTGLWSAEIQYAPIRGNDFFRPAQMLSFQLRLQEEYTPESLPQIGIRFQDKQESPLVSLNNYLSKRPTAEGWIPVQIPLADLGLGTLSDKEIKNLAAVVFKQNAPTAHTQTLYIDEVELLPTDLEASPLLKAPAMGESESYERHIDLIWTPQTTTGVKYYRIYRSEDGKTYAPIGVRRPWMNRYTDFVDNVGSRYFYRVTAVDDLLNESEPSSVVMGQTHPLSDEELLDMIQRAQLRYYWEGAEPNSGLARENIPGRHTMIATGASGFGMMAILCGTERGFISRPEAVDRFLRITEFLEKSDRFHGAYAHFIDGTTGKTEPFFGEKDNGGDLVETSFLFQGLLAARQYFDGNDAKESLIRQRIDRLWKEIEWSWYKRYKNNKYLFWHWSPDQAWVINHQLIGWNETMITYLLAIMAPKYGVSPELYYTGWASQEEIAQQYRANWGQTQDGSMYTNGNTYYGQKLDVGVSNGGPLFFIHYSYLGLDPHLLTDAYTNYFENNRNMALINHRYCTENPGKYQGYGADCWGLTASDFAWNYQAQEPILRMDNGTIAPTGALASFPYTPQESMAALRNYYRNYGKYAWSEYGFRDAFNLSQNWCSPLFMGLNQAPVVVMIENYRSGLPWKLFMSHPDVKRGLQKLEKVTEQKKLENKIR